MRALLLAAGLGTRLGAYTQTVPKCLLEINNQTMLGHWLAKLDKLGVDNFTINTHYLSEQVEDFVANHTLKDKISIDYEQSLRGTGGTLLNNISALSHGDCFVVHVDNYCEDPLEKMVSSFRFRPDECLGTMLTFETPNPRECGVIETDQNNILTSFYEKVDNPKTNIANGAVYLFSQKLLNEISATLPSLQDISKDLIPLLVGKLNCYFTQFYFEDIGRPTSLKKTRIWVENKKSLKKVD